MTRALVAASLAAYLVAVFGVWVDRPREAPRDRHREYRERQREQLLRDLYRDLDGWKARALAAEHQLANRPPRFAEDAARREATAVPRPGDDPADRIPAPGVFVPRP